MSWVGVGLSFAMMMGGLITSMFVKNTQSQTEPVVGGIKIITSAFGLTRSVVYGDCRITGNVIWYGNYKAIPHTSTQSAGGKAGGSQEVESTTWNYYASFALGLCEGPISKIVKGWAGDSQLNLYPTSTPDKTFVTDWTSSWTIKTGTADQTAWPYLVSNFPSQAIKYPHLAYVAAADYHLGSYPNMPNFQFIVEGLCNYYGDSGTAVENHLLSTSVQVIKYVDWIDTSKVSYINDPIEIDLPFMYVDSTSFVFTGKCDVLFAAGRSIIITVGEEPIETPTTVDTVVYSGGNTTVVVVDAIVDAFLSKVIVVGPVDMVETTGTIGCGEFKVVGGTHLFSAGESNVGYAEISYSYRISLGGNAAEILTDIVTNTFYGLGLAASVIDLTTYNYEDFCMANEIFLSPQFTSQSQAKDAIELMLKLTLSEVVWDGNKLIVMPLGDQAISSSHGTWTPNLLPECQIGYDDFTFQEANSLVVSRSTSRDAFNNVSLTHVNKENEYNTEATEYQDQADMITHGNRPMGQITANGINTKTLALKIGRLLCKRSMKVRNKYSFSLPLNFIFNRCLDIVGLTSAHHGLVEVPVRITNIVIGKAELKIEAEDLGVKSMTVPALDISGDHGGYTPDKLVNPEDANTPILFVPPLNLANYQVWLATSGGVNWGGCHIWVSEDGDTYLRVVTMAGGSRYGELSAQLPAIAASPDTTNTLSVDLSASGATLTGGTTAEATSLRLLSYVDGEYISFRDATLTGPSAYDLDYLVRGCYGSAMGVHEIGSTFVRLDSALFKYPFDSANIGKTIWVKLQSFNTHGHGTQNLADLTEYEFTIPSPGSQINRGFNNLQAGNNGVSPDTKIDVSYDSCDMVSTNGDIYSALGQGFTIDLSTVGLNGIDAGTLAANTWYYLFSVANAQQQIVGGLASLSPTAPTLPSGYTHKQIVGAVRTDGDGDLYVFSQIDYEIFYGSSQTQDTGTAAQTWADQDLGNLVPPISTRAYLSLQAIADADDTDLFVRKNGSTSTGQISGQAVAGTSGRADGWVDTDLAQGVEIYISEAVYSWTFYVSGYRFNV